MGQSAISAIALDFGGTIAAPGASPHGRDVVAALQQHLGWPSPTGLEGAVEDARAEAKAAYRRGVQTPWESILAAAWQRLDVEAPDLATVVAAMWETVPDAIIDPAAADAVWALRRTGRTLILACNTQRPLGSRRRTLAAAGLGDCFDALILSSEIGIAKPDPRFYAAVADAARTTTGCVTEAILFVGDTLEKDVIGPFTFGMRAALVHEGPSPSGLPAGVPVVARVADLPDLLERWP